MSQGGIHKGNFPFLRDLSEVLSFLETQTNQNIDGGNGTLEDCIKAPSIKNMEDREP